MKGGLKVREVDMFRLTEDWVSNSGHIPPPNIQTLTFYEATRTNKNALSRTI